MNAKKAKAIRRDVYGDYSIRHRRYLINRKTGQIIADDRRRAYQAAKKPRRGAGV